MMDSKKKGSGSVLQVICRRTNNKWLPKTEKESKKVSQKRKISGATKKQEEEEVEHEE